jgi:hypothetical protein
VCALASYAQEALFPANLNKIQPGRTKYEDAVKLLGQPAEFAQGRARYDGATLIVREGVVHETEITNPAFVHSSGLRAGATVAEVVKALGEPKQIVKTGLPERERQPGVLYENTADRPGAYWRDDLGVVAVFRDDKVLAVILTRSTKLAELPKYDPNSRNPFQMDLRGADLSSLDLRERESDLVQTIFDTRTKWPSCDRLPAGFDPARILETGKNPGLGVRTLHKRGITGKGVGIAVVDNPLRDTHEDYAARVKVHEWIGAPKTDKHFHGTTALSIAAGKTGGVAPDADVYYISGWNVKNGNVDYEPRVKAFERIIELNRTLPEGKKIRVLSMQLGWRPGQPEAAAIEAVAKKAKDEGMLVITSSVETTHGFKFHGLGREPLADPDKFESYLPGQFWSAQFYAQGVEGRLLVPMDSRSGAGSGSDSEWSFYRRGGWSWATPYIAGVYALACQVDPSITPDRFWDMAMKTGRTIEVQGRKLGPIIDPVALMAALEKGQS